MNWGGGCLENLSSAGTSRCPDDNARGKGGSETSEKEKEMNVRGPHGRSVKKKYIRIIGMVRGGGRKRQLVRGNSKRGGTQEASLSNSCLNRARARDDKI